METSSVASNQLFLGGMGLYGVAMGAFAVRHLGRHLKTYIERSFFVSLEVSSRDVYYRWIMRWIAAENLVKTRQFSIMSTSTEILANDRVETDSIFIPAPNVSHMFKHKNKLFFIKRSRPTDRFASTDSPHGDVVETLSLTAVGRDTAPLHEIFNAAKNFVAREEHHRTVLYNCAGTRWIRFAEPRRSRSIDSVILRENLMRNVIDDLSAFAAGAEWYHKMGIPYRRGYLLYGPPGCGKSSLVLAIAGRFSLAICMLNLSSRSLDDDTLNQLLNAAPKKCAILLEDIDLAFHSESRITISGLLNALDGVTAQEGRVVFMTTNHIDRLSKALIRPGRVDVRMYIGHADGTQMKQIFLRFFPGAAEHAEKFASLLLSQGKESGADGVSIAEIQGFLFCHKESPKEALEAAATHFQRKCQREHQSS